MESEDCSSQAAGGTPITLRDHERREQGGLTHASVGSIKRERMAKEHFRLMHPLRVRWAEIDGQGVVFNGHYLTYFDVAVTEYWRSLGWTYAARFIEHGVDTFAVKAVLEYRSPARYDDELEIGVRVTRFGRTSLTLALEIHRGVDLLVNGQLVYVFVDVAERRPVPIPQELREAITEYEPIAPEQS